MTAEELEALLVGKNNISKLLISWGSEVQVLETATQQVLTQRTVDTAIGAQLDVIGAIVTLTRDGLDDDTFRRYCRAEIAAHDSTGTVESIIRVLDLVIAAEGATYQVVQQTIATCLVFVITPITAELALIAFNFLQRAAATGVRVILAYGTSPPEDWFRYDAGPGFDDGHYIGSLE